MKKLLSIVMLTAVVLPSAAQEVLTLDSCRALALRNNKQLNVSKLKKEVAVNTRKAARTKYLPKVDAIGGYQYFSREISVLSNSQKTELSNIGTTFATSGSQALSGFASNMQNLQAGFGEIITNMVKGGVLSPAVAQQLSQQMSSIGGIGQTMGQTIAQAGNQMGQKIVDAFDTDTRNIWSGAIMVRQPIFMGGAISAANRIADIGERVADNDLNLQQQSTLYNIDQAYWMVVSLKQKQKLAISYRDLVKKLDEDVHKMIKQGVATRADGLKVDVKVNEAEMQISQVEDGLTLSRMLLCQLCGLPMEDEIKLADEDKDVFSTSTTYSDQQGEDLNNRPELKMLESAVSISEESQKLVQAAYLPHVALTGGYLISNPNMFNGFQNKFGGVWNVGVTVQIPVWNWFEGVYKVRATKAATTLAVMQLNDAREKIQLQVTQSRFKVKDAQKKLAMAKENIKSAEENMRCANIGFREGVMQSTEVMAAQTAWQQAQTQLIDAEINVKLSQVGLSKALGTLGY